MRAHEIIIVEADSPLLLMGRFFPNRKSAHLDGELCRRHLADGFHQFFAAVMVLCSMPFAPCTVEACLKGGNGFVYKRFVLFHPHANLAGMRKDLSGHGAVFSVGFLLIGEAQ